MMIWNWQFDISYGNFWLVILQKLRANYRLPEHTMHNYISILGTCSFPREIFPGLLSSFCKLIIHCKIVQKFLMKLKIKDISNQNFL